MDASEEACSAKTDQAIITLGCRMTDLEQQLCRIEEADFGPRIACLEDIILIAASRFWFLNDRSLELLESKAIDIFVVET